MQIKTYFPEINKYTIEAQQSYITSYQCNTVIIGIYKYDKNYNIIAYYNKNDLTNNETERHSFLGLFDTNSNTFVETFIIPFTRTFIQILNEKICFCSDFIIKFEFQTLKNNFQKSQGNIQFIPTKNEIINDVCINKNMNQLIICQNDGIKIVDIQSLKILGMQTDLILNKIIQIDIQYYAALVFYEESALLIKLQQKFVNNQYIFVQVKNCQLRNVYTFIQPDLCNQMSLRYSHALQYDYENVENFYINFSYVNAQNMKINCLSCVNLQNIQIDYVYPSISPIIEFTSTDWFIEYENYMYDLICFADASGFLTLTFGGSAVGIQRIFTIQTNMLIQKIQMSVFETQEDNMNKFQLSRKNYTLTTEAQLEDFDVQDLLVITVLGETCLAREEDDNIINKTTGFCQISIKLSKIFQILKGEKIEVEIETGNKDEIEKISCIDVSLNSQESQQSIIQSDDESYNQSHKTSTSSSDEEYEEAEQVDISQNDQSEIKQQEQTTQDNKQYQFSQFDKYLQQTILDKMLKLEIRYQNNKQEQNQDIQQISPLRPTQQIQQNIIQNIQKQQQNQKIYTQQFQQQIDQMDKTQQSEQNQKYETIQFTLMDKQCQITQLYEDNQIYCLTIYDQISLVLPQKPKQIMIKNNKILILFQNLLYIITQQGIILYQTYVYDSKCFISNKITRVNDIVIQSDEQNDILILCKKQIMQINIQDDIVNCSYLELNQQIPEIKYCKQLKNNLISIFDEQLIYIINKEGQIILLLNIGLIKLLVQNEQYIKIYLKQSCFDEDIYQYLLNIVQNYQLNQDVCKFEQNVVGMQQYNLFLQLINQSIQEINIFNSNKLLIETLKSLQTYLSQIQQDDIYVIQIKKDILNMLKSMHNVTQDVIQQVQEIFNIKQNSQVSIQQ